MNFKVIYKGKTHESVVASEMKDIDQSKLTTAFMVVATESVQEMDKPYIAIQLHENQTMVGTKQGATKVTASSIYEALNSDSPTTVTIAFGDSSEYATSIPNNLIVNSGTTIASTDIADPVYDDTKYRFDGWTVNGEPVVFPYVANSSVTFEASWTLMRKVTFTDPDSHASELPETIIVPNGTELGQEDIPDPTPASGYEFAGYKVGSNDLQFPLVVTHDFTLKATFTSI